MLLSYGIFCWAIEYFYHYLDTLIRESAFDDQPLRGFLSRCAALIPYKGHPSTSIFALLARKLLSPGSALHPIEAYVRHSYV